MSDRLLAGEKKNDQRKYAFNLAPAHQLTHILFHRIFQIEANAVRFWIGLFEYIFILSLDTVLFKSNNLFSMFIYCQHWSHYFLIQFILVQN